MSKNAGQRINELRKQGYKVNVKQLRQGTVGYDPFGFFSITEIRERRTKDERFQAHPRGGKTEVTITGPAGLVAIGEARCRVDDYNDRGKKRLGDMFNKNLGLTIALNRAEAMYSTLSQEMASKNGGHSLKTRVG